MAELPNVRLNLANTAENVVVVRAAVSSIADGAGVDANDLADIRTAVTEACNNVVLHAYAGEPGPMDVAIELDDDTMRVTVRDRGVGVGAGEYAHEEPPHGDRLGIGLHVIRTLARRTDFDEPLGGGTRVRMELSARGLTALEPRLAVGPEADLAGAQAEFDAAIGLAPVALARTVMPRLARTLAARAHFSTDRLLDLQLLCDSLAAHAEESVCERRLSLGVSVRPRDLQLLIAPLRTGGAHHLIGAARLDRGGVAIEQLADRREVIRTDAHELLAVSVRGRHRR